MGRAQRMTVSPRRQATRTSQNIAGLEKKGVDEYHHVDGTLRFTLCTEWSLQGYACHFIDSFYTLDGLFKFVHVTLLVNFLQLMVSLRLCMLLY